MPMIDVYSAPGTFAESMAWPRSSPPRSCRSSRCLTSPCSAPTRPRSSTSCPLTPISNVDGAGNYVRVQVLTNAAALDRDKQLAVVEQFTAIVADAAGDSSLAERTWVLLTEAVPGGWGLYGHASTDEELIAAARAEIAKLRG